jgi:BA14K-like protein
MPGFKMVMLTAALALGASLSISSSLSALPLAPATGGKELAINLEKDSLLLDVRYWGRRGYYWGPGVGFTTGLALGGYYRPYPYYYAPPPYAYGPPPYAAGDAVAYCMQRFRSYDPGSGTYRGFDGLRHPCP